MPIHLDTLSRRQFINRSALAVALLAFGQRSWGGISSHDPHHLALLSDTHISADLEKAARGIKMKDTLQRVVKEVLGKRQSLGGVLINGDCAYNRGIPEDYAAFAKLVEPLRANKLPIHCTLGNHDHRDNFLAAILPEGAQAGAEFEKQVSILETPRANWFLLDTLDEVNSTPGALGESQRKWLQRELDSRGDKPAILFAHHNLDTSPGALRDTSELLEILRPRKQVKAYIFGHTHSWKTVKDSSGIHLINLPPTAYVFRETDPHGWVEAKVQRDGMELELHCLDKKHRGNGKRLKLAWRKA